jgi:hypothetical protein
MENEGITQIPTLFEKPEVYNYPCSMEDSLAPNEVEAKLKFGNRTIYVLAPITKVDKSKSTIQIQVIGRVADSILISLLGEVENAGSTVKVKESDLPGIGSSDSFQDLYY